MLPLGHSVLGSPWHRQPANPFQPVSFAYFRARSYSLNRFLHVSMTAFGVARLFFAKTSTITMASLSIRNTSRQLPVVSFTRSSWHLAPIDGIGREAGISSKSPRCRRLRRNPASMRPSFEKGGDLTSPCNHTNGLCFELTGRSICQNGHMRKSRLTNRWSGRVKDKVPSSSAGARAAQLNRQAAVIGNVSRMTTFSHESRSEDASLQIWTATHRIAE